MAAALAVVSATTAVVVADVVDAATTIHVAPNGDDDAAGTAGSPLASVGEAVRRAADGDAIEIRSGTYHESVQVFEKRIHLRGVGPTTPVFDGAQRVVGFVASGGDWFHPGWDTEFQINAGPMVESDRPEAGHPDQMFLDGVPLRQVLRRSDVASGTFFHDTAADRLWIGDDPTGRLVEASKLSYALYLNRADGSSLTNVTARRYATESRHQAAIRAYADDVRLRNVTADSNAFMGLSIIGDGVMVEDGSFVSNGYIGVHGDRLSNVVLRRNSIARNNAEGFNDHHSAGGLKFTRATGVLLERNEAAKNAGPGLWTDIDSSGITMIGNLVTDNDRSGLQIELTANVTLVDNVAIDNGEAGVWILESQNVDVWHNAIIDNRHEVYILEGPREDVTQVTLRNNILGDAFPSPFPILTVNDWTHRQPASDMQVFSDHNYFWRRSASAVTYLSWWGRWPEPWAENRTLDEQISTVSQDRSSVDRIGGSVPVRSSADFDYRGSSDVPLGQPLTPSVARSLGAAPGSQLTMGPVTASPTFDITQPYGHGELLLRTTISTGDLEPAIRVLD